MKKSQKKNIPDEGYSSIVWKYFKLHANQRITLFRFYIIFFSLFAIVIGHLISEFHFESNYQEWVVIILSVVFILITIIFWYLDNRNRNLIHNSEEYFLNYEKKFGNNESDKIAKIFTREKKDTENGQCIFRHTFCFRIIYSIGFALAIIFIIFSICSICDSKDRIYHKIKIISNEEFNHQKFNFTLH